MVPLFGKLRLPLISKEKESPKLKFKFNIRLQSVSGEGFLFGQALRSMASTLLRAPGIQPNIFGVAFPSFFPSTFSSF
jgi:hypothetical protein